MMRSVLRWIYCILAVVCTVVLIAALFAPFDASSGDSVAITTIKKMYLIALADALFIGTFVELMKPQNKSS